MAQLDLDGLWRDQRVRYLLVGGFNTLFALALFAWLIRLFGHGVPAVVSVIVTWVIAVTIAFFLHRLFVFKVEGHVRLDLARFMFSNLAFLLFNLGTVALLVDLLGFPAIPVQIGLVPAVLLTSYITHKYFSFRRPPEGERHRGRT